MHHHFHCLLFVLLIRIQILYFLRSERLSSDLSHWSCATHTVKKKPMIITDHCDARFWPVAVLSGCIALLSVIFMILLVTVVRWVRSVFSMVSDVRPLASTLNKAITSGTRTAGGDDELVCPAPRGTTLLPGISCVLLSVLMLGLLWQWASAGSQAAAD